MALIAQQQLIVPASPNGKLIASDPRSLTTKYNHAHRDIESAKHWLVDESWWMLAFIGPYKRGDKAMG
jgi:hypothetical protein